MLRALDKIIKKLYILIMRKDQQISTWIFMMLTILRKQYGLPFFDFLSIIKEYKLVYFLTEQYELLHYYDNDYIVSDIIKYIEEQGGNIDELFRTT